MKNIVHTLPEEDLTRLLEDTGLTAEEIAAQYAVAVKKAKAESNPKKAVNRLQRRWQERQIKKRVKEIDIGDVSRPITDRFEELDDEKKKEVYLSMLERVRAENDKFERMKERDANGERAD